MNDITIGPFSARVVVDNVVIQDDVGGTLTLLPAETAKAAEAVAFARQILNMKVIPECTQTGVFQVDFTVEKKGKIHKIGVEDGCNFDSRSADALVEIIKMTVDRLTDEIRIRGGARPGVKSFLPDPPFEGR